MYKMQRGVIPSLTTFLGIALLVLAMFVSLNFALPDVLDHIKRQPFSALDVVIAVCANLVTMLLFLWPVWFLGVLLVAVFPPVRLVDSGVKYRAAIFSGLLKWDEIERVIRLPNDYVALSINRKGLYFLNGLSMNRLYGILIRHENPVLLMAPGLDGRAALLAEILSRTHSNLISSVRDLYT